MDSSIVGDFIKQWMGDKRFVAVCARDKTGKLEVDRQRVLAIVQDKMDRKVKFNFMAVFSAGVKLFTDALSGAPIETLTADIEALIAAFAS